jgi:hypothetical protein
MPDFQVKRLNFRLKEFTRNVWVSNDAGEIWHPRIIRVLNYLREIDLHSVAEGIRRCTIRLIGPDEANSINNRFSGNGLQVRFIKEVIINKKASDKQPFKYWAVIGTAENNQEFKQAFLDGNHDEMSLLQGSPKCCTNFFHKWGIDEKWLDMTWPMAVNTLTPDFTLNLSDKTTDQLRENLIEVEPVFQCNTLLKSLGVKAVFHSPCSFNCADTVKLADQLIALGEKLGYHDEISWLRDLLSWPVDWSALHGIAEIKTPVLKISTWTDATAEKYTVRFKGTHYPEETLPGLVFPYLRPEKLFISESKGFQQGLLNNTDEKNIPG